MKSTSTFQIVFTVIFAVLALAGVAFFALSKSTGSNEVQLTATIWGVLDKAVMDDIINKVYQANRSFNVTYIRKPVDTFNQQLIEAIADGVGPDIVILPQSSLITNYSKLLVIPYVNFPEKDFKQTFVEEGEIFLHTRGILALPFSIDPMIMYWNRDLFSTAGIVAPPTYWDEFYLLSKQLTRVDPTRNILQSAASLGGFDNILNAKDLLSALFFQAGNKIIIENNNFWKSTLKEGNGVSVINFYTQFANPTSEVYLWNNALPEAKSLFLAGNLATYFGFASDLADLRAKNPNLNFGLEALPQLRDTNTKITYGRIQGLAILRSSRNPGSALAVAKILVGPQQISEWSTKAKLPPVRRDLLPSFAAGGAIQDIFAKGALQSRGWYDPNPGATRKIFGDMIESIISGRENSGQAIQRASLELDALIAN